MGMSTRPHRGALVFDVEAAPIDDAVVYLETPVAPSNYSKPEAIEKYVEKAKAEQLAKCALDVDLARIVAIGMQFNDMAEPTVWLCKTEAEEKDALESFWDAIKPYPYPRLVGFNVCGYDIPLMLRRSLYLGVDAPPIQIGRYRHPDVDDLMLDLSFDGALKLRGLAFYCKRFGIDIPDPLTGADIGLAVAEGRWDDVRHHVTADILKTAALAAKLGYFDLVEAQAS